MAIVAINNSKPREIIPAGNHVAVCYEMIHVGTYTKNILGQDKELNEVRLTFELSEELREFEGVKKPLVITQEYTLSMHEKSNLRKHLESWRGKAFTEDEAKAFDVTKLLGVPCMLNVIHRNANNGNTYANIGGITPLHKSMAKPEQFNPSAELSYGAWDQSRYDKLPSFIKERMEQTEEYKAMFGEAMASEHEAQKQQILTQEETDGLPF